MHFLPPLAHGALGVWDEAIPLIMSIAISVISFISAILSRRRDKRVVNPPENPRQAQAPEPEADPLRLD